MGRFTGNPLTESKIGQILYDDFQELRREPERLDQQIIDWTKTLSVHQ